MRALRQTAPVHGLCYTEIVNGCTTRTQTMTEAPEIIEVAAGEVTAELKRRGISSDERVIVMIEPERELIPGRRASRARVVAARLTDDDIDVLIKQAQQEVEPKLG
jgi:hypothetical protein